jgi:hypothetical protein
MAVPSPINTTSAPRAPSPLWIIALFIALSEFMAGVAVIATSGRTQMVFAVFAVVFPAVVLISSSGCCSNIRQTSTVPASSRGRTRGGRDDDREICASA